MNFDDWQKDEEGKVEVFPLVAFETFVPHGVLCGLKVHYLEAPEDLLSGRTSSVPLVISPELARGLAAALNQAADEAEHGPGSRELAH
jgi:hypothetical protein